MSRASLFLISLLFFLFLCFLLLFLFLSLPLVLDVRYADEERYEADKNSEDGHSALEELNDLGPPLQAPGHRKDGVDGEENEDNANGQRDHVKPPVLVVVSLPKNSEIL